MRTCINLPFGLSKKEKENFKRQYWFIECYEESVKEDYLDILKALQYKIAISPWHDKDVNQDGSLKKKHRHILIDFGGSVRTSQVCDIADSIQAKNDVMYVGNKKLAFEYLTHKNDADKYQYNSEDIILLNSKIYDWLSSAYKDILNFIDDYHITSLVGLTKELRKQNNDYLLEYVSKNSYYICAYIKEYKEQAKNEINELISYVHNLIIGYDIDHIMKSETINAIRSKLEQLKILGFDIVEDE